MVYLKGHSTVGTHPVFSVVHAVDRFICSMVACQISVPHEMLNYEVSQGMVRGRCPDAKAPGRARRGAASDDFQSQAEPEGVIFAQDIKAGPSDFQVRQVLSL